MKRFFTLFISILSGLLLAVPNTADATHASAAYISYTHIAGNTYQLTLRFYRDCSGVGAPGSATISYSSSCASGSVTLSQVPGTGQPVEQSPCVPPVNTTCTGGTAYGVQEWEYTGTVNLGVNCADWVFSYSLCCRNNAIGTLINPGSHSIYVETTLNNLIAPVNNSPVFGGLSITEFCVNSPVLWNQFATDIDGDSLAYSLVCPKQNATTSVNFAGGYSCASPIAATPPVAINATSGQITFTPTLAQVAVLAVKVDEYRGGILIGSVTRDMQINVVAGCTTIPFDNAWLGYNDNWDDPINWCLGIPTLTTNAVVRSLRPTDYFSPVIKEGVFAQAKSLKISNNDSVTINAPKTGSLTMADSLQANTGELLVAASFGGGELFGPGLGVDATITPFYAASSDTRMQIIYTAAELAGKRMIAGDKITDLCFQIFRRRSVDPYQNFNINYFTTAQSQFISNANLAIPTSAVTNVYSNPAPGGEDLSAITLNTGGVHTVTLTTPIVWDGVSNIVLEICYDEFVPNGSNLPDLMTYTTTAGRNSVHFQYLTGLLFSAAGCAFDPATGTQQKIISDRRPNIEFKFYRQYDEYPIYISGAWHNNGDFRASNSRVTFNGLGIQTIGGTSITTFDDVEISKGAGEVSLLTNTIIDSSLILTNRPLRLNTYRLTMNYNSPLAFNDVNGYIISENLPPNYGTVRWNIGSTAGAFKVPFGNIAARKIPVTLTSLLGDFGQVDFSTYATGGNNLPYPAGVTNLPDLFTEVVDRFWILNRSTGGFINTNLTLSYDASIEETTSNPGADKRDVKWNVSVWDTTGVPFFTPNLIAGRKEVTRTGINVISQFWAITNKTNPLPIELLTFDGEARTDHNYLWWVTATEVNTDKFEIEKSLDLIDFEKIGEVKAAGWSNNELHYDLKDNYPIVGIQYYRLKTIDIDGSYEYSKPIAVYYGLDTKFEVISLTPDKLSNKITVDFIYNSSNNLNIMVTDLVGKTVYKEIYSKNQGDNHHIEIDVDLSSAMYFITFFNEDVKVSKKFAY